MAENVTDEQITRLRDDARLVRNYLLADYCRRALAGDTDARETVRKVLAGEISNEPRNYPLPGDSCPHCGETSWGTADPDPQQCGACGTRVCPVCGADFAEDYTEGAQDRLSDNMGDHVRQWHPGVTTT